MLKEFIIETKKAGLTINYSKTVITSNSEPADLLINGVPIKYVTEVTYLGQTISFMNKQKKELERRVTCGWRKYWALSKILKGNYSTNIKAGIFDACVTPTITYGSQTWALTNSDNQLLQVAQRKMERSMLGVTIKDKIRNEDLRKRSKMADISIKCSKQKWRWAGHVARMNDNRWTKRTTEWYPRQNTRNRGRQRKRWHDDLMKLLGTNWTQIARNKNLWKENEEAFTLQG